MEEIFPNVFTRNGLLNFEHDPFWTKFKKEREAAKLQDDIKQYLYDSLTDTQIDILGRWITHLKKDGIPGNLDAIDLQVSIIPGKFNPYMTIDNYPKAVLTLLANEHRVLPSGLPLCVPAQE
jgi:hypothetical protein